MTKRIIIEDVNLLQALDGNIQVVCTVSKQYKADTLIAVQQAKERLKNQKLVAVTIDKYTKPRSLDANAYFHVLVEKIATAVRASNDEVKARLVVDYGQSFATARLPKDAEPAKYWKYYRIINESDRWTEYLLYKPTHLLESDEMARLIEGAVAEAKQLKIETMTTRELASLMAKGVKNE